MYFLLHKKPIIRTPLHSLFIFCRYAQHCSSVPSTENARCHVGKNSSILTLSFLLYPLAFSLFRSSAPFCLGQIALIFSFFFSAADPISGLFFIPCPRFLAGLILLEAKSLTVPPVTICQASTASGFFLSSTWALSFIHLVVVVVFALILSHFSILAFFSASIYQGLLGFCGSRLSLTRSHKEPPIRRIYALKTLSGLFYNQIPTDPVIRSSKRKV